MIFKQKHNRGMTLIDVIVGTALVLIIFLALMGVLRASILVANLAKARAASSSIASSKIEYLRGISYDSLGTIGGIPAGTVPPVETVVSDGIKYTVRTYIQYIDDPADGLGVNDTNGITTDYKKARISIAFVSAGKDRTTTLVSNFSPPGLETTNGGGTLSVKVVNAAGLPLAGATVRIVDTSLTPAVDVSTFSNVDGLVYLPGAATSTQYQVFVSKDGYSNAQTYMRDTNNQNPTPGYLTVAKDQTTTGTFVIDLLTSLKINTYSPKKSEVFSDTFVDTSKLSTTTNTTVSNGALTLSTNKLYGTVFSISVQPSYLNSWGSVTISTSTPTGSSVKVRIYNGNSGLIIPDTVLSGNSVGFSSNTINISNISTSTYPSLEMQASLASVSTTTVPQVLDWSLGYVVGPTPLPNVPFVLTGTKTIGSTGSSIPIYKTVVSATTDSSGSRTLSLPWDAYSLSASNYDIANACLTPPYTLPPGSTRSDFVTLASPATTNRLLVAVQDTSGAYVPNTSITLFRTGYSSTVLSSSCGDSYFGNLTSNNDYIITIIKKGYATTTFSNVNISGQTIYAARFQ